MDILKAGKPFVLDKITLVPIEHILTDSHNTGMLHWLTALKEPSAIVVCEATGIRCFSLEAKEISLELLIQSVPGLDELLTSLKQ